MVNKKINRLRKDLIVGCLVQFVLASIYYFFSNEISGVVTSLSAISFYFYRSKVEKNYLDPIGLFTLTWCMGYGLSELRLSNIQIKWELKTLVIFILIWVFFYIGYYFIFINDYYRGSKFSDNNPKDNYKENEKLKENKINRINNKTRDLLFKNKLIIRLYNRNNNEKLLFSIVVVTIFSLLGLIIEWFKCGYLPFLSDKPHAYSYFHMSGVHYFTVLFVIIPSLIIIYIINNSLKLKKREFLILLISLLFSIFMPIIIVSRFQLILSVGLAFITYFIIKNNIKIKYILILMGILILGWIILTIFRNHSVSYLNNIFEMKNKDLPIWISQPYIYICNNFDNFNVMVRDLTKHTYGSKMALPILAFTGIKFLLNLNYPAFVTKGELTTSTMFSDSYSDFGIVGVLVLSFLIGMLSYLLIEKIKNRSKINNGEMKEEKISVKIIFSSFMIMYIGLSFFDPWFSNPTTWFYFGVVYFIYLFVEK